MGKSVTAADSDFADGCSQTFRHMEEEHEEQRPSPLGDTSTSRRGLIKNISLGAVAWAVSGGFLSASPAIATSRRKKSGRVLANLTAATRWDLSFGKLASLGPGGYVTVDSETGTKLVTGSLVDLGGRHQRARLDIRGEPGEGFVIFLPATLTMRGRRNSRNRALVTEFRSFPSTTGFIGKNGRARLLIGATVEVGGGQAADIYRVRIPVRVRYL